MPQPAALDVLQEPLLEAYRNAWRGVQAEQEALATNPLAYRRKLRLTEMQRRIEDTMGELDEKAGAWVSKQLPKAYLAGAAPGSPLADAAFSQINQEAVQRLAGNLFQELIQATQHVNDTTKRLVRAVAQDEALQKAIIGKTADQAAKEMRRLLEDKGIHAIRYADGSKHGLAEYTQVAMRTTTAKAYNSGTLGSAPEVGFFEIFDGPSCGLSFHDDPTLALGLVVDRDTAEKFLISHPNCRRSFGPRPDITTAQEAKEASPTATPEQRRAQLEQDAGRGDLQAQRTLSQSDARDARLAERQARVRPTAKDTQEMFKVDGVYGSERQKIHDAYVNGQLAGGVKVAEPEFRVMGGGAASGKSSIIRSGDVTLPEGHVMVNADEAKEALPDYNRMVAAKDPKASAFVHEESSDMGKRLTQESLGRGYNTVLDGVGNGSIESLAAKIEKGRAAGAKRIVGDYVTVDTDEAVRRAVARGEKSGRFVPEEVIRHGHEAVSKTFYEASKRDDLFDELRLWDNNGSAPRLIYDRTNGVETIHDQAAWGRFLDKNPELRAARDTFPDFKRMEPQPYNKAATRVNPGKGTSYRNNCHYVAPAMEMRARGYDVVAAQTFKDFGRFNHSIAQDWLDPVTGEARKFGTVRVNALVPEAQRFDLSLEKLTADWPPGARGFLTCEWKAGNAHIWNVYKDEKGVLKHVDGQVNKLDARAYLGRSKSLSIMRVDDLEPRPDRLKLVVRPELEAVDKANQIKVGTALLEQFIDDGGTSGHFNAYQDLLYQVEERLKKAGVKDPLDKIYEARMAARKAAQAT